MKKIFLSILTAVLALTATAQNFNVNTVVVYKNDGTRDTTFLAKKAHSIGSYFYGKENPVDDDYIKLNFTLADNYDITCSCSLTPVGQNAPYDSYGSMLSSNHIDSIPKYSYYGNFGESLYIFDTQQWYRFSNIQRYQGRYEYMYYASNLRPFKMVPGQNYYARAYYLLDGKVYYSSEIELRAARTVSAVREYYYGDYASAGSNVLIKVDAEKIFSEHTNLFGTVTNYKKDLLVQYISRALGSKEQTELQAMATKTEECDNGTLYIIEDVPASVLDEALQLIDNDMKATCYLQANKDNLYTRTTSSNAFRTTTNNCTFDMVTADEKWGIRDNQYLLVSPNGTYIKPTVAFELPHLVQPGKTYDVTLTFAPNTMDETDSLRTCFDVLIADLADDGTVPLTTKAERFGTDTLISNKPAFIAMPHELKVMTMQYTAKNFVDKLYLQIENPLSVFNARNRYLFSFEFRIVGVEVKPHEE